MDLTLTPFLHRKDQNKKRFDILILLKRLRFSAKCYSNSNYQLNILNIEATQPQTVEVKVKGKNLPEILTHTL